MFALVPSGSNDYYEIHDISDKAFFTGLSLQKEGKLLWRVVRNPEYDEGGCYAPLTGEAFILHSTALAAVKRQRECFLSKSKTAA